MDDLGKHLEGPRQTHDGDKMEHKKRWSKTELNEESSNPLPRSRRDRVAQNMMMIPSCNQPREYRPLSWLVSRTKTHPQSQVMDSRISRNQARVLRGIQVVFPASIFKTTGLWVRVTRMASEKEAEKGKANYKLPDTP